LRPEQAVTKFRKSTGAPMCGRFGHVLGKPGSAPDKLAKHFAQKCEAYGEPLPPQPLERRLLVVMPDPDARDTTGRTQFEYDNVNTCASCRNFIRDDVVADELGWTTGLCAAKGKLILTNQQTYEARNCEYRRFGQIRQTTAGLHLLPEYDEAFGGSTDPIRAYFEHKDEIIEPHEYPTDREVTEEEAEGGIRAWRRVLDPEGTGNEVFLPIYRIDFFDDEEQSKIPRTGDDEHPELYVDHFGGAYLAGVTWTELDETPALWGEAGTGKTELGRYLAWLMCLPFVRISITGQTELDDLAGKMRYTQERGTYFQYGRVPLAWSKPCVLTIDEPNVGPPDVWQFFRPLFDNSKQLVLDTNEGERIKRHQDCYPMLAMNPAWDPKNVGTMQIGDADASRLFHVHIELPPESLEREIIKNRVKLDGWEIPEPMLNMVMAIAKDVRAACADDTLPITWGIRPQIKVARALRWFDPITAYRRAVGDYLEPEAQQALLDFVRQHNESTF
jgi:MoxR-like ATPase